LIRARRAGESDKARSAKEEARELKLQEEYSVRKKVEAIKRRLSLVLKALGLVAVANPAKAHEQLPALVSFFITLLHFYDPFELSGIRHRTYGHA
jgi:chromatin segregation and condensation protein Rec8/ScpA/Scc1 (kleisin family)